MASGDRMVTPRTDLGILAGTTQADIFRFAEQRGYTTSYELLTPQDLAEADAAWLVSSVRHAAPIRSVDGVERRVDAELSDAINAFLRTRTE
jgi:4-amino-4-deoxychorismate lyase